MLKEIQRLRVKFSRGEEIKYITHLDLLRCWERVLRRAQVPLAYSQGFAPHPKISLASPLSLGITSEAELMDVFLTRRMSPSYFIKETSQELPRGIEVMEIKEIYLGAPSLQAKLRATEYRVDIETNRVPDDTRSAIASLLQADHFPWCHMRDTGPRHYDLRALIEDIWAISCGEALCTLGMRLKSSSQGSGRPEQVTAALGFSEYPISLHRTKLFLAQR